MTGVQRVGAGILVLVGLWVVWVVAAVIVDARRARRDRRRSLFAHSIALRVAEELRAGTVPLTLNLNYRELARTITVEQRREARRR